jgi:hypothetical protein
MIFDTGDAVKYSDFELKSKVCDNRQRLYVKVVSTGRMLYAGDLSMRADIQYLYGLIMNGTTTAQNYDGMDEDFRIMIDALNYLVYLDKFMRG